MKYSFPFLYNCFFSVWSQCLEFSLCLVFSVLTNLTSNFSSIVQIFQKGQVRYEFHLPTKSLSRSHIWTRSLCGCAQLSLIAFRWHPGELPSLPVSRVFLIFSLFFLFCEGQRDWIGQEILSFFLSTTEDFCSISRNCFNNGRLARGEEICQARITAEKTGKDGGETGLWINRRPKTKQS